MKSKCFLMFLAIVLSCGLQKELHAQKCLVFSYDAGGNRVSRSVDYNCNSKDDIVELHGFNDDEDLIVYPMPAKDYISIVLPDYSEQRALCYEIYSVSGMLLFTRNVNGKETTVNVGNLQAGVYLLRVTDGENVRSKIILKQ